MISVSAIIVSQITRYSAHEGSRPQGAELNNEIPNAYHAGLSAGTKDI
jgi:hypothetical protein